MYCMYYSQRLKLLDVCDQGRENSDERETLPNREVWARTREAAGEEAGAGRAGRCGGERKERKGKGPGPGKRKELRKREGKAEPLGRVLRPGFPGGAVGGARWRGVLRCDWLRGHASGRGGP